MIVWEYVGILVPMGILLRIDMRYINEKNWQNLNKSFIEALPFRYTVVDDFFTTEVAEKLILEFPDYNSSVWNVHYNNPLENKKACDHWLKFPPMTYQVFHYFCGVEFTNIVKQITGNHAVQADYGLHGGGLHCHAKGGNLNIHLDYSIHPKLKMERHYNLIVYLTPNWNTQWGGGLELWSHNFDTDQPEKCITRLENKFNRAVIFDTTQNSWHGLPENLSCPEDVVRRSMAMYYVTELSHNVLNRPRARFAPYGEQSQDPKILELIEKRKKL